ncbi:MAG TPA: Ig-like domain-containing protein [Gemmatimonadales bacterium]|nr:Ig-like domain-containing protein [Gemmatimonadales bacterium]
MTGTLKSWLSTTILLAAATACGSENEPPGGDGLVVAKAAASGDAQTGPVGVALASPLAVIVTRDGAPAEGVTVNWSVQTGGGALGAATSATGAQGIATMTWTLGSTVGAQTARATVAGATGSPVSFSATATAGAAGSIALSDGDGQSAEINTALDDPLEVEVTDALGNPVAGVTVSWAVTAGGGSVAPATSVTNAAGLATTVWTLGAVIGAQAASASAAGLTGSPVAFAATGTAQPNPGSGVTVGNNFFNPATRTVPAGSTVTWTWVGTGQISHSVLSTGTPSFASSQILVGEGQTYSVQFDTPGTYTYECEVHGSAMSGQIVVQ